MRGEDLVVVVRRQITHRVTECPSLLDAHHDRVGETAQQHHDAKHHVHDADLLVIDAREPFAPEIAPLACVSDGTQQRDAKERNENESPDQNRLVVRSEEHTSELQSLMRISYAVFCLKKKTT